MMGERSRAEWIAAYEQSHRHPVNKKCHAIGIPVIMVAFWLFVFALVLPGLWKIALPLWLFGWTLQFVGHAYERKPPEFFKDPRFLLVGWRWWRETYLRSTAQQ